jgi:hypothetical protein
MSHVGPLQDVQASPEPYNSNSNGNSNGRGLGFERECQVKGVNVYASASSDFIHTTIDQN